MPHGDLKKCPLRVTRPSGWLIIANTRAVPGCFASLCLFNWLKIKVKLSQGSAWTKLVKVQKLDTGIVTGNKPCYCSLLEIATFAQQRGVGWGSGEVARKKGGHPVMSPLFVDHGTADIIRGLRAVRRLR
jgi:hypothetical protein